MGVPSKRMGAVMCRILIVDDDEPLVRIIGEYLSAYGFEPELAYNSEQALDRLMHSRYAAVLSDFLMPGESGLDLLNHVKSRYPGLPFILMTGLQSSRLRNEAMKLGSSGYIEKPFELKNLVATITAALELSDDQCRQDMAS
jgi:DNA-binding NtrC family response regulator